MSEHISFSGFGQNVAATITAAVFFGVIYIVKHKCRHSRCNFDSKCIKCSADDIDTLHERPNLPMRRGEEGETV